MEINLNKNRSFNEIIKREIEEMKLSDYILHHQSLLSLKLYQTISLIFSNKYSLCNI